MDFKTLFNNILYDIKVDLSEEFDRNFERKAFFNEKWPTNKIPNNRGSLMQRTGGLRDSFQSRLEEGRIVWSSSLPYASIHNEGGEIEVTEKMKSFFWAMYYKASGAVTTTKVKGERSKSKRNMNLEAEAEKWRSLALLKVGTKMRIEKRQIIGYHPDIDDLVKNIVDENLNEYNKIVVNSLKQE